MESVVEQPMQRHSSVVTESVSDEVCLHRFPEAASLREVRYWMIGENTSETAAIGPGYSFSPRQSSPVNLVNGWMMP